MPTLALNKTVSPAVSFTVTYRESEGCKVDTSICKYLWWQTCSRNPSKTILEELRETLGAQGRVSSQWLAVVGLLNQYLSHPDRVDDHPLPHRLQLMRCLLNATDPSYYGEYSWEVRVLQGVTSRDTFYQMHLSAKRRSYEAV
jgi:hypothetical protein